MAARAPADRGPEACAEAHATPKEFHNTKNAGGSYTGAPGIRVSPPILSVPQVEGATVGERHGWGRRPSIGGHGINASGSAPDHRCPKALGPKHLGRNASHRHEPNTAKKRVVARRRSHLARPDRPALTGSS